MKEEVTEIVEALEAVIRKDGKLKPLYVTLKDILPQSVSVFSQHQLDRVTRLLADDSHSRIILASDWAKMIFLLTDKTMLFHQETIKVLASTRSYPGQDKQNSNLATIQFLDHPADSEEYESSMLVYDLTNPVSEVQIEAVLEKHPWYNLLVMLSIYAPEAGLS